jgi:hypothetical protein
VGLFNKILSGVGSVAKLVPGIGTVVGTGLDIVNGVVGEVGGEEKKLPETSSMQVNPEAQKASEELKKKQSDALMLQNMMSKSQQQLLRQKLSTGL